MIKTRGPSKNAKAFRHHYFLNIKIRFTLLVLLISTCNSFGQSDFRNGFIITLAKDTIYGEVDYRSNLKNYNSCLFKDGKFETEYFPKQILGFGYINDKFFTSQIVSGNFAEVLVSGKISLYKTKVKYHLKKDTTIFDIEYNFEKVDINGNTVIKKTNRWRGIIAFLISDCLDISKNYSYKIQLSEKNLTQLIVKYNKCSGKEFTEYKASKPWTKFMFGASLGVSKSEIHITENTRTFSYLDDSYSSVNPTIGLLVAISSPRITERIAFQGEIHFIKSAYSSLIELDGVSTEYHDTYIDLSTLSVPLSLKYSFPEKKCGWYLQGGINYEYHLISDTKLLSEYVTKNVVNTSSQSSAFEVNDNQIGYWGGIGVLKSYRKIKGSISIRYFQMSTFNNTEGFFANNNRISLNLILFKK